MANKNVIKIDIKKTTQDFEIGSKTYTMGFSDEEIKRYGEYINNITAAIDDAKEGEENNLDDIEGKFKKVEDEMRGFIDIAFGKHAYDEMYKEVNGSSIVLSDVVVQVIEQAQEQMDMFRESNRQQKKAEYYKKKNK